MPSYSKLFLRPFIGGLNTEGSDTIDSVVNTSDELNCTILPEGKRGRRYGFNIEKDGKWLDTDLDTILSGSMYIWNNVGKSERKVLVIILGSTIKFFDASSKPFSLNNEIQSIDLTDFIIDKDSFAASKFNFISGGGSLIVVNKWVQPIIINYDAEFNAFNAAAFSLLIRDIEGVEDSWGIKKASELINEGNTEPTASEEITKKIVPYIDLPSRYSLTFSKSDDTKIDLYNKRSGKVFVPDYGIILQNDEIQGNRGYPGKIIGKVNRNGVGLPGGSSEHSYNLRNQGWTNADMRSFKESLSYWPDNTLAVSIGRDKTGKYNTGDVVYTYLGNTRQPRGHFILNVFEMNRSEVSGIFLKEAKSKTTFNIGGISVHNRDVWPLGANSPVSKFSQTLNNSQGSMAAFEIIFTSLKRKAGKKIIDNRWSGDITVKIYGWKGAIKTFIGQYSGHPYNAPFSISGSVTSTEVYERYTAEISFTNGNGVTFRNPLAVDGTITANFREQGNAFPNTSDASRITDVAYMGGRYFYLYRDTVLFSQTIGEDCLNFDKCYQEADPTSSEISDIVTTDGGYIKFNSIGEGLALSTFNRGVIVFGRESVYGLISSVEGLFSATNYDIIELSKAGLIAPESIISTSDKVYYWSPLGIFTIGINHETGNTLFAQSVSLNTIQTYYNNLPEYSKRNAKGAFDYNTNKIYWYYPTDPKNLTNLDGCLTLDLNTNAFMPFKISNKNDYWLLDAAESTNSYEIEPTVYVKANGNRVVAGENKVVAFDETITDFHRWTSIQHLIARKVNNAYQFSLGDYNDREFLDWATEQYASYMVSRPITLDDTYFNKQTPVMQTLFQRTESFKLNTREDSLDEYVLQEVRYEIGDKSVLPRSTLWLPDSGKISHIDVQTYPKDTAKYNKVIIDIFGYINDIYNLERIKEKMFIRNKSGKYSLDIEEDTKNYDGFIIRVYRDFSKDDDRSSLTPTARVSLLRRDRTLPKFNGFKTENINTQLEYSSQYIRKSFTTDNKGYLTDIEMKFNQMPDETFKCEMTLSDDKSRILWGPEIVSGTTTSIIDPITKSVDNIGLSYTNSYNISKRHAEADPDWVRILVTGHQLVPIYTESKYLKPSEYITPSGAFIRMRWGWSLESQSNRWDMLQNGYRPQKDFIYDDYVESRLHIRGRGKAFQIEIRNDENKDFRVLGLNIIMRNK